MRQLAEFVAVFACGIFTGAAVYVSLVEHPARMECGVEIAAAEFSPSYRRGSIMQATLAALGLGSSIAAWLAGATFWWLVGGVALGTVIPFTLIVILPTNKQLLSPTLDRQTVSGNGAATRPLGRVACCEKPPQCSRTLAIPVSFNFREGLTLNADGCSTSNCPGFLRANASRRSTCHRSAFAGGRKQIESARRPLLKLLNISRRIKGE